MIFTVKSQKFFSGTPHTQDTHEASHTYITYIHVCMEGKDEAMAGGVILETKK